MEALGITVGDIIVVGILGIAALMGTALGLVKAVLFVASWAGAAAISYFTYQDVTPYFLEHIQTQRIAEISAAAAVFIVALIVLFFVFSRVWKRVKESE
ncbi:MAG: CvpA family protein, partial [Pseudomonadota bacterium]|nr:CvpA family protein [Pseudomonadota bacterium]